MARRSWKSNVLTLSSAAVVCAGAAVASVATPAAAAPATDKSSDSHCVMIVDKAKSPTDVSETLFSYCGKTAADATERLNRARVKNKDGNEVTASSSDLLMTWWSDRSFGGSYTSIYGGAGPCDSAGYRVKPNSYWQVRISSVSGGPLCNWVDLTTRSLTYADDFDLPTEWIGSVLNDNVGLTHVYNLDGTNGGYITGGGTW